jgi:opacity protein-like surface antigen
MAAHRAGRELNPQEGEIQLIKKGLLAFALAVVLSASPAWAQTRAEITPFIGYQFGGKVELFNGDLKIGSDINYGAILDITVRPGGQVELSYTRQDTELRWRPFVGEPETIPMNIDYWQIGGLGYIDRGPARPFFSATLGVTHFMPDGSTIGGRNIDDEWRFSFILGGGVKYFPSERVGLRLGAHLYSTLLDSSSGLWCGAGGCSLGLFGYGIFQGDVQAGLTVAF